MASRVVYPTLEVEQRLWGSGSSLVAGVDEVGMGPLAGPVVAAAAVFPRPAPERASEGGLPVTFPAGVRDSKTLTPKARERLEAAIRAVAAGLGIGVVEVGEIDRINIYQAGLKAMRLAVARLPTPPDHVVLDGRRLPDCPFPQTSFPKGDRDVYSIAAASIIAKTYRDRLMADLDRRYPEYGFARHKGYATAAHREAIRRCGPCPAHRRSFRLL